MMTTRWGGEDVHYVSTTVSGVSGVLPSFRRMPLSVDLRAGGRLRGLVRAVTGSPHIGRGSHKHLDAIVLTSTKRDVPDVPIAVVSRSYSLIPHRDLARSLEAALSAHVENAGELACDLALTEYGGRMKLRIRLPSEITPPDGDTIQPTLECLNSVDGTARLQLYLGWFRFVCSNGLVIGQEVARLRRRHVRALELPDIETAVSQSLGLLTRDTDVLQTWWRTPVGGDALRSWVDGPVAVAWGPQAAARVWHIARTGYDCRVLGGHRLAPASRWHVEKREPVPGSAIPNDNAYRVSQILAFVGGRRRDIEAAQEHLAEIPRLMARVVGRPELAAAAAR